MRRRRDHPDVAPVDESAGGSTLAPPDPEQLRQEAADLIARAEKIDAEQAERERQAAAEQAERERQHLYLTRVAAARGTLAVAVDVWTQAGDVLEVAQADRDEAQALVDAATAEAAAGWAALEDALKGAGRADLERIYAADISRAARQRAPGLLTEEKLQPAEAALRSAKEARQEARAAVVTRWEELVWFGPAAVEDMSRPECLPEPRDPNVVMAEELVRKWEAAQRYAQRPEVKRRNAIAAASRERAARQAADVAAGFYNDVIRAARG